MKGQTLNPLKMPYKYLKSPVIRLFVGIAILSLLIGRVAASPTVIHDSGKTIDAQQFYPFQKPNIEIKNIPRYTKKSIKRFPVVSSMLSPGKVKSRKIRNRMPRAICVVGGDKQSRRWIKKNRSKLESVNALCMAVNVKSRKRFRSIKSLAPNIDFQALNGDVFYKELQIKHYPFLLNKGLIRQ